MKQMIQMDIYVGKLESQGYEVHFPPRDVDQSNDDGGIRICREHLLALRKADEVHVWWEPKSMGSHYDLGMAAMLQSFKPNLKFYIANAHEVHAVTEKSFQNILVDLAENAESG